MLPAFPEIERLRDKRNLAAVDTYIKAISPFLRQIRRRTQFEGRLGRIDRHDDSSDTIEMKQLGAESEVKRGPLADFTEEALNKQLSDIAEQFARQQSEHMFTTLNEGLEKVGNVVDGGGAPVTEDLIFEIYEKMHFSFDARGRWQQPTMIGGEGIENVRPVLERVLASPRFATLLEKKRDDHRRREAARILVG